MSRWHERHCTQPEVQVLGGLPCCCSCYAVASIDDISVDTTPYAPRPVPDERSASFNLRWPSSVKYGQIYELYRRDDGRDLEPSVPSVLDELGRFEGGIETIGNISGGSSIRCQSDHHTASDTNIRDHLSRFEAPLCYPILLNSDDIRLLVLDSGEVDSLLHATFTTVSLGSELLEYDALSYTWADENGNSDLCRPLFMGPFWDIIPITRNCESALRNIRSLENGPRSIWVDSVCINQTDDKERSRQVALMSKIYSRAFNTRAYLGPVYQDSDAALKVITSSLMEWTCSHGLEEQACEDCTLAVRRLQSRPYFRRLWVVQEVILSKQVIIHCGSNSIVWPHNGFMKELALTSWAIHRESSSHTLSAPNPASKLVSLLVDTRDCLCRDPRDKLFALLGLAPWNTEKEEPITPDYSLTLEEVCIGIAAYLMTKSQGKKVLLLSGISQSRQRSLPSWVPDISQLPPIDKSTFLFNKVFEGIQDEPISSTSTLTILWFYTAYKSRMTFNRHTASLQTRGVQICNLRSSFSVLCRTPGMRSLIPKGSSIQHSIRPVVYLPELTQMSHGNANWFEDTFTADDHLYWIHGVDSYAILRQQTTTGFQQLVCACDVAIENIEPWKGGTATHGTLFVDTIYLNEQIFMCKRWDRLMRKATKSVDDFDHQSFFGTCTYRNAAELWVNIASWTNSQRVNYYAERRLWQTWLHLEEMVMPLLTDETGMMALTHVFERADLSSRTIYGSTENAGGLGLLPGNEMENTKGPSQRILKLLWSLLSKRQQRGAGNANLKGTAVMSGEKMFLALQHWAEVTEKLFNVLAQSKSPGEGLCQVVYGNHLCKSWGHKWAGFAQKVLPESSGVIDSADTIEHLISLFPRTSEQSGGRNDPGVRLRDYTWAMLTEDLLWDWNEVERSLEKRWKFWQCLENDKWMAEWKSVWDVHGTRTETQLALRCQLRPFGFNLDIQTGVTIV